MLHLVVNILLAVGGLFSTFVSMQTTFKKIAAFQYSAEALIIKGRLEAEGVEVFLADNNTIDVDPFVSNAIGGVKLFVRTDDVLKAEGILNEISRYAIDDSGSPIACPNCGNHKVEVMSTVREGKSLFAFIIGALVAALPFYTQYKYHCNNCGHEFKIK